MIDLPKTLILYLILSILPIAVPIHEIGHLMALDYLGIGGVIESDRINTVMPLVIPVPDDAKLLVYTSGGLYQCLVFFVISLFLDKGSGLPFKMVSIEGFITAIFEPNNFMRMSHNHYMIGVLFALMYFGYALMQENRVKKEKP